MTVFFDMPPMSYAASPRAFVHRRARCVRAPPRCGSSLPLRALIAVFFAFVLLPLVAPLIKLAFLLMSIVLFHIAPAAFIAMALLNLDVENATVSPCKYMKSCMRASPTNRTAPACKAKSDEDANGEASKDDDKDIHLVIAAPGIKPADLKVTLLENTISIKGETQRGDSTFNIDKTIVPPRLADMDTAECTHADGIVTITMQRKISKRIPVRVVRVNEGEPIVAAAAATSEDDWVAED